MLKEKGPLLLACNHPNSFLDAVLIDALFEQPVYSLARGDVFKKPFYIKLLTALKILPVYRVSEGVENLSENYKTFDACLAIFKTNGIVQIFSEGKCINEWHLRPLKKGTARLSLAAWEQNIPLRILPVGTNYSSFRKFGKNVFINFGEIIKRENIDMNKSDGGRHLIFNNLLEQQLKQLVFEIDQNEREKQKHLLEIKLLPIRKVLLFLPAMIGFVLHAPLYLPLKSFTWKRTKDNDHYDSVLTALLLVTYPLYLLLIVITAFLLIKSWFVILLVPALPFTAWSYVQLKPQIEDLK